MDFSHDPHWAKCFCRYYHTNCSSELWQKTSGEENRKEALEAINSGTMKGYLAFDGDKCIGWCNANDIRQYIRLFSDLTHIIKDLKVGCPICFVIHPEYRKQGVARLLLKTIIEDFKKQDFDAVLSLPVDSSGEPEKLYRGTFNMYKENGFEEIERHDNVSVMMLKL